MKYIFLLAISILIFSCFANNDNLLTKNDDLYISIENDFVIALRNYDFGQLENIINKINENELDSNNGYKYLKIKIMALTSINKYELALELLTQYQFLVCDEIELNIAMGLLHYILNYEYFLTKTTAIFF